MEATAAPLLPLFERERAAGRAVALGVLVHTNGSTYRKPGALILIAADGSYAGLLSGGCLESDLSEHARTVIETGTARLVSYDMRGTDDLMWGLGLGCEGVMQIVLLRAGPENDWQPLAHLSEALQAHAATTIGVVTESSRPEWPVGRVIFPGPAAPSATPRAQWLDEPGHRTFLLTLDPPPRIVLFGAGPDASPVVDLAARLSWHVTLTDHRPAYAIAAHFPGAERVLLMRPESVGAELNLDHYGAAVVMSHHLPSDIAYLRVLAASRVPYVGLLGPAARRERILAELGSDAAGLNGRLHAPVGLPLGGRTPESIALSIVAQLQSFLHAEDK
jgi:xanthine dehydrogenase accessory factor